MNRRKLLSVLGAGATLTSVSTVSADAQTLEFQHVCEDNSDSIKYQFAIDGEIVDPSPDDEDEIIDSGEGGRGYVAQGGIDTWAYSGTIQEVRANAPLEVRMNGDEIVPADCDADAPVVHRQIEQDSGNGAQSTTSRSVESESEAEEVEVGGSDEFCRFDNGINIRSHSEQLQFELATTSGVEKPNGQRVSSVSGKNPIGYRYAGKISSFSMRGRGRVSIDQQKECSDKKVTTGESAVGGGGEGFCEFNQEFSASTEEGQKATIKFGASHNIQLSEGGQRVPAVKFTVPADSNKHFKYAGWLTALSIDGKVEVRIRQSAPCADQYAEK